MTCGRKACTSAAPTKFWQPIIELRHASRPDAPAHVFFPFLLCDDCKAAAQLDDFMGDAGFAQLSQAIVGAGKRAPTRSLTTLTFRLVDDLLAEVPGETVH